MSAVTFNIPNQYQFQLPEKLQQIVVSVGNMPKSIKRTPMTKPVPTKLITVPNTNKTFLRYEHIVETARFGLTCEYGDLAYKQHYAAQQTKDESNGKTVEGLWVGRIRQNRYLLTTR
jgi:hypothetical protein